MCCSVLSIAMCGQCVLCYVPTASAHLNVAAHAVARVQLVTGPTIVSSPWPLPFRGTCLSWAAVFISLLLNGLRGLNTQVGKL